MVIKMATKRRICLQFDGITMLEQTLELLLNTSFSSNAIKRQIIFINLLLIILCFLKYYSYTFFSKTLF